MQTDTSFQEEYTPQEFIHISDTNDGVDQIFARFTDHFDQPDTSVIKDLIDTMLY